MLYPNSHVGFWSSNLSVSTGTAAHQLTAPGAHCLLLRPPACTASPLICHLTYQSLLSTGCVLYLTLSRRPTPNPLNCAHPLPILHVHLPSLSLPRVHCRLPQSVLASANALYVVLVLVTIRVACACCACVAYPSHA